MAVSFTAAHAVMSADRQRVKIDLLFLLEEYIFMWEGRNVV